MMAMLSPITGKPMTIHREWRQMTYRKETFDVCFHTWYCEESGRKFEDETFAQLNYDQVINQYREKHNIPFPDEIKAIREQYNLSATRMSQALGFGDNTYRQYEAGEIPTEANARLIQLAANPDDFLQLLKLADLPKNSMKIACENAEKMIKGKDNSNSDIVSYFFPSNIRNRFTGFQKPSFEKFTEMIVFFCNSQRPWKTKLNKLLFYADFAYFKQHGVSLSGATYCAIPMGPVPDNFDTIFEYLVKQNILSVDYKNFSDGGVGEKYIPNKDFDSSLFSPDELSLLQLVDNKFKNSKTQEIIDLSHQETAWLQNQETPFQPISYFFAFDLKNA